MPAASRPLMPPPPRNAIWPSPAMRPRRTWGECTWMITLVPESKQAVPAPIRKAMNRPQRAWGCRPKPTWANPLTRALAPKSKPGLRLRDPARRWSQTPPQILPAAITLVKSPRDWGLGPSSSLAIKGARPGWKKPTRHARAQKTSTRRRLGPHRRQAAAIEACWPFWLRCSALRLGAISQSRVAMGTR